MSEDLICDVESFALEIKRMQINVRVQDLIIQLIRDKMRLMLN